MNVNFSILVFLGALTPLKSPSEALDAKSMSSGLDIVSNIVSRLVSGRHLGSSRPSGSDYRETNSEIVPSTSKQPT